MIHDQICIGGNEENKQMHPDIRAVEVLIYSNVGQMYY